MALADRILVATPCKLAPGMFPGERLFTVKLANDTTHSGIAPRYFCWNKNGELVAENEPATGEIDGFLAARVVDELDGDQVAVEIPNGEVIAVDRADVRPRPTEIRPPSHPAPLEDHPNVPVGP